MRSKEDQTPPIAPTNSRNKPRAQPKRANTYGKVKIPAPTAELIRENKDTLMPPCSSLPKVRLKRVFLFCALGDIGIFVGLILMSSLAAPYVLGDIGETWPEKLGTSLKEDFVR